MLPLAIAAFTGLATAPAYAQSAQHDAQPVQHTLSYEVVSSSWLASTSPALPNLPSGLHYSPEVLVKKIRVQVGIAIPDSASGCTPAFGARTCIYVNGSGLKVVYWTTDVNIPVNSGWIYPNAYYLVNGAVRQEDDFEIEGSEGGAFTDPLGYDNTYLEYISGERNTYVTFANNTKLCNFWTGASIKSQPCETVKS